MKLYLFGWDDCSHCIQIKKTLTEAGVMPLVEYSDIFYYTDDTKKYVRQTKLSNKYEVLDGPTLLVADNRGNEIRRHYGTDEITPELIRSYCQN